MTALSCSPRNGAAESKPTPVTRLDSLMRWIHPWAKGAAAWGQAHVTTWTCGALPLHTGARACLLALGWPVLRLSSRSLQGNATNCVWRDVPPQRVSLAAAQPSSRNMQRVVTHARSTARSPAP